MLMLFQTARMLGVYTCHVSGVVKKIKTATGLTSMVRRMLGVMVLDVLLG